MEKKEEFIVSWQDADIIAGLFQDGICDFESIVNELEWDDEKRKQFYEFITLNMLIDLDHLIDLDDPFGEPKATLEDIIIPEEKHQEFFDMLPIEFDDDWFDEDWYHDAHEDLREVLVDFSKKNVSFKKKKEFTIEDAKVLIGMTFCMVNHKPENLCSELQTLVIVDLRKKKKSTFTIKEIQEAFDRAFENYYD